MYYRGAHGAVVVYDVTSGESFGNVKRWLHEIDQNCDQVQRILVGNKCEDPERRVVLDADALRFAEQMNIGFLETSAKDNINVFEMFNAITRLVLEAKLSSPQTDESQQGGIQITSGQQKQKKSVWGKCG